ncbi:MAG TPA: transposase family protein [Pyrinomonadaceae bacterium]|nr:transposase family protein [Pyrinomonadaceae bacterium]
MFNYRLRRDMHIKFRGREYVIEQRLSNGDIRISDIALNESKAIPQIELLDALFDGSLEFLGDGRKTSLSQRKIITSFVDDITMLDSTDSRKAEFKRRLSYIKQIQANNLTKFNAATLEPIIKRVHDEIKDTKGKPYWKTVYYGWFVPFIFSGEDIRAFIPNYKRRGNHKRKFTGNPKRKGQKFSETERQKAGEVAKVIDEVINEEFMNEQRLSIAIVCDKVEQRIAETNEFRDVGDRLPIPHPDSIYDIIRKMDQYEKDKARYGKLYAEQKHEQSKRGPRPMRPLERVEIDHTTLDLFIVDAETGLPVGRPTITVAIDKYSRMIVGMHVGFDPPAYLSVMRCLLHAITPKRYVETDFTSVENKWNTYGIPEHIVIDNALEFHCEDLEDACSQLGIHISYSPVKYPWYRASVERFFGTQNRRLLHNQPGTTFSNIIDKGDYDPKKNAIISFDAFMEMLHIWIIDIYSQQVHRGLEGIPAHVWDKGIDDYPPRLPRRQQELRVIIGQIEHRKIGRSGIRLFNLTYNNDCLALLRRELKGKKAKLKFNPDDLSIIYVYNSKDDRYVPVLAEDQEYTKGLSLWQHEVIQSYIRRRLQASINRDSLRRAKKKIQAIVDREWLHSHKTSTKAKMARWKRIQQRISGTALEMAGSDEQSIGQVESEEKLITLNPTPSPFKGISDIGNSSAVCKDPNEHDKGGFIVSAVGTTPPMQKTKRNNSRTNTFQSEQDTSELAVSSNQSTKGDTTERVVGVITEDELNMSGFKGTYDLPVHGGINE